MRGTIAVLVSSHYLLRLPSLPSYLDIGLHYTLWESLRAFATDGMRNLFLVSVSLNGAVVALFLALIGLLRARARDRGVRTVPGPGSDTPRPGVVNFQNGSMEPYLGDARPHRNELVPS